MEFVQTIAFTTKDIDTVRKTFESADRSQMVGNPRSVLLKDRENPDRYLTVVTFDSYDDAMKNNDLPQTQEFAAKMRDAIGSEPEWGNFDLIQRDE